MKQARTHSAQWKPLRSAPTDHAILIFRLGQWSRPRVANFSGSYWWTNNSPDVCPDSGRADEFVWCDLPAIPESEVARISAEKSASEAAVQNWLGASA